MINIKFVKIFCLRWRLDNKGQTVFHSKNKIFSNTFIMTSVYAIRHLQRQLFCGAN
jgi:hypothetical protein